MRKDGKDKAGQDRQDRIIYDRGHATMWMFSSTVASDIHIAWQNQKEKQTYL